MTDYNMLGAVFQPGGGLNEPYCVEVAQNLRARHNVVINNGKVAELIQPFTGRVICRSKTLDWNDDNFASWDEPKVRAFVRRLHNESPAKAVLHLGNEQGVGPAELRNTDIGMDECEKLGRIAVIHNRAVKSYGDDPRVLDIYKPNFERAFVQGHLWGDHATYFDRYWQTSHLFHFRYLRDDLMKGRFPEVVFTEGGCCFGYQAHRGYRWGSMPLSDTQHGDECTQMAWGLQDDGASVCLFLVSDDRQDNEWVNFIMRSPMITYMKQHPVPWKQREVKPPVEYQFEDGIVAVVGQQFARVRSAPIVDSDPVKDRKYWLGQVTVGQAVSFDPGAMAEGSGYSWWVVEWNGRPAYIAHENTRTSYLVCDIDLVEDNLPALLWDIPYISQKGTDANSRGNDCGIACSLMLYNATLEEAGLGRNGVLTVDAAIEKSPLGTGDSPVGLTALAGFCRLLGMDAVVAGDLTPARIRELLADEVCPILLVSYKHLNPGNAFTGGHYCVAVGQNHAGFFVHDPLDGGEDFFVSNANMQLALTDLGSAAALDYQGVLAGHPDHIKRYRIEG